jgi:hypothetical protein
VCIPINQNQIIPTLNWTTFYYPPQATISHTIPKKVGLSVREKFYLNEGAEGGERMVFGLNCKVVKLLFNMIEARIKACEFLHPSLALKRFYSLSYILSIFLHHETSFD